MPIYPNFYQTLTPCPVVELRGYAAANGLKGRLFAYLDFNGPTGTARDGLAEGMLALAIEQKKLAPGQPIIEAVSGPFATALTLAGLTAGHPVVLVMPEDAPALRQENLLRLGAQIQSELIAYSGEYGCADTLLAAFSDYQAESLSRESLETLTSQNIYSIWFENDEMQTTDEDLAVIVGNE